MAIGNMSGFRLPSMMEDINIEEIVSRAPAAKKKAKLKELTGRMRGWKEKRAKTKAKSRTKAKPVVKAKAKPKPPTKPRSRPGIRVGEDLANRPKKVAPKPTPRTKPRPKPRVRPSVMGGEDFAVRPTYRPKKVVPRPSSEKDPTCPKISGEDLMRVSSETKGRSNIPNINLSSVIPGANINIQEIIEQATRGGSTAPAQQTQTGSQETTKKNPFDKFFEGSMDGTTDRDISEMTWEEIDKEMNDIRFASRNTWGGGSRGVKPERYQLLKDRYESIAPISRLEKDYDRAGYNRYKSGDNVGEGYLEEGERLKKLIESRRGSQDSQQPDSGESGSTWKTLKEFFEKMKSQQKKPQDEGDDVVQRPQPPKPMPQWDIMGQQQQTGPVVAPGFPGGPRKGPWMPSPRPPTTNQMFGGYGGTAPIVPSMPYAGMGNFPQMPRMQAPQYDPDAEPGGPPMPTGPVFT